MTITWPQFREHAVRHNDGCASLALARRLGVPDGTWKTWQRRHDLPALLPGTRAVLGAPTSRTLLRAALDSLGDHAVLGGRSALWALYGAGVDGRHRTPQPLEVVATHAVGHRTPWPVHVRRSRTLLEQDRVRAADWPCTSPARTAMDLVARLDDEAAMALLIDLVFHGLAAPEQLTDRADSTPTAVGAVRLARLARPLHDERSDSIFEWLVRRHLERTGFTLLPGPQAVHTPDGTFEVDIMLAGARVAVECHGSTHREHAQLVRDIAKADALSLAGWVPLGTTYAEFVAAPSTLVAKVQRALGRATTPSLGSVRGREPRS